MEKMNFTDYFFTTLGGVATLIITGFFGILNIKKQLKLQKNYQDTKDNLPILLEILNDLNILHQAFLFKGTFCPLLEHRCPTLTQQDSFKEGEMSYAQRTYQFHLIGLRVINNCRKIIYLTPKKNLPETLKICKKIKESLSFQEKDKKTHLDLMITTLSSYLSRNETYTSPDIKGKEACKKFQDELLEFYQQLDLQIEKELPYLSEKS